ncbi:hypothetical protein PA598K_01474 [Paenibacillus sp. 598K]|uniref:helix-turn-helix domain-containing protein n=1 Tax=Paenibacillus sp. 598K TaxID=1117987 RepID=UPI000FF9C075|nr:hypothetical protein PA598K_01474 [Paenibacillus sp. 598K]
MRKKTILEEVFTASEAASFLGLSKRQVYRLCDQDKLIHRRDENNNVILLRRSVIEYEIKRKEKTSM